MKRRHIAHYLVGLALAVMAPGCEDGPNDTYSPQANTPNGNKTGGSYFDPSHAPFDASFPGKSAQEICSTPERAARWKQMVQDPIIPPRIYAGIDMAKDDSWVGITIEEAEHINCQATNLGAGASSWGDNNEVFFFYDVTTHIVTQMQLGIGYNGTMKSKSRDGAHSYEMGIGKITKDNQPFIIKWGTAKGANEITELMDAALATFAPTATPEPGGDGNTCDSHATCLDLPDAGNGTGIFGFRPLAIYFILPDPLNLSNAVASKPIGIYNFFTKSEPYSKAPLYLKIDAEGPTGKIAITAKPSMTVHNCNIHLGMTWASLISDCIKVSDSPSDNTTNYNKLTGGHLHDFTKWIFSTGQFGGINGVNVNFFAATKANDLFSYIKDADLPADGDLSSAFIFDVRASSTVLNDRVGEVASGKSDLHGTAALMWEYVRSSQERINSLLPANIRHNLGDPVCLVAGYPKPAGCTGLEGFIIRGQPASGLLPDNDPQLVIFTKARFRKYAWDNTTMGFTKNTGQIGLFTDVSKVQPDPAAKTYQWKALPGDPGEPTKSILLPGDPAAYICDDPLTRGSCQTGPMWDFPFQRVRQVLGNGDIFNLPSEVRDRRFFFKEYGWALVRYLKSVGLGPNRPADLRKVPIDLEALFFDNAFSNQFDTVEYIDRTFMSAQHPYPTDVGYGTDVKVGNQRYTNFFSYLDREEYVMYQVMAEDKNAIPGSQNNLQVTNLAGSPVLANAFADYKCASDLNYALKNQQECGGVLPPTDANGGVVRDLNNDKTELFYYRGAWEPTVFALGSQAITIDEENLAILGAKISIPNYANPYDPGSPNTPVKFLVPWIPVRPDVGFAVPLSGQRDKWVSTGQMDFAGVTTTILVDYLPVVDDKGVKHAKIVALETQDFLGEVFVCQDPNTGDILSARMYTSAGAILDWLDQHPGTRDACDIILRYSPFNNYPDFITSRANGVKLNISQGAGFGRVVDVILYDPAQVG